MSSKIIHLSILPDPHVETSWELPGNEYRQDVTKAAKLLGIKPIDLHRAVLQSIYNVHLRVIDHLKLRPAGGAALPIVAKNGRVLIGSLAAVAPDLKLQATDGAKETILASEREAKHTRSTGKDRMRLVGSSILRASDQSHRSILAINEFPIQKAVALVMRGEVPHELLGLVARETYLGFALPDEVAHRVNFLGAPHTIRRQAQLEDERGAAKFQTKFPKLAEKHYREDFAPLIRIIERTNRTR